MTYLAIFALSLLVGLCAFAVLAEPEEPRQLPPAKPTDFYEGINDR